MVESLFGVSIGYLFDLFIRARVVWIDEFGRIRKRIDLIVITADIDTDDAVNIGVSVDSISKLIY